MNIDKYARQIDYLRISVTDKCNLRCLYCMPEEGIDLKSHKEILRFEEILRIVKVSAKMGVSKIRITGGEPLVRKGIIPFVEEVANTPGIKDVAMTTNGILLAKHATKLKTAGLNRVNISLDTLDKTKFKQITRIGDLNQVWDGIYSALDQGIEPVKLNVVVMRNFNYEEINDFVELTKELPLHVRFIELMPIGESDEDIKEKHVSNTEVMDLISKEYTILPNTGINGAGPAKYMSVYGHKGTIGFISAMSNHFCSQCNRLRLTAEGKIRPCLQNSSEIDLKTQLRSGCSDEEIAATLISSIKKKPKQHTMIKEGWKQQKRMMFQIGG